MTKYAIQRFISMVLVIFIIATATFFLMRVIPGGPFSREKKVPPQVLKNLERRYNLDWPLWKQYADYMWNLARGDLGPSFRYQGRTVNSIIKDGFPVSATLGFMAVCLALLIGIPAGIISALNQNKWQDNLAMLGSIIGVSIPSFVLAVIMIYVFGLKLGWLPTAMWGRPSQAIMPAIALALGPTAVIARLMRSTMLEVIQQDYIKTARAKGLPQRLVIYRHALKNALIPVVTFLGPYIAAVFTGSFVIERMFAIPGLGRYYVNSIYNRDYTVALGVTIFYSALLVFMNFVVDITYAWLDPRIQLTEGGD